MSSMTTHSLSRVVVSEPELFQNIREPKNILKAARRSKRKKIQQLKMYAVFRGNKYNYSRERLEGFLRITGGAGAVPMSCYNINMVM